MIDVRKSAHMLYIIPLTILFTGGSYFYIDSLFGYPTTLTDEGKFLLISFHPSEDEELIYMWVVLENEVTPKAITIPYSKEKHRSLLEAQDGMSEGRRYIGEFQDDLEYGEEQEQGAQAAATSPESAGGTEKSRGGSFSLLELDVPSALPAKAEHGLP